MTEPYAPMLRVRRLIRVPATLRILLGLMLGLGLGMALAAARPSWGPDLLAIIGPIGQLWLRALQMTIVPLVFSLIVTGVASLAGQAAMGGLPARAIALFAVGLLGSAVIAAVTTPLILQLFPPSEAAGAVLRAGATGAPPDFPPLTDWLTSFVPANPIAAAAETQMVGLVVFALIFGLATARLPDDRRGRIAGLFDAVVEAMLIIVQWVLLAAPIGVFALALGVGSGAGLAAAGALVHYVLVIVGVMLIVLAATYAVAITLGRCGAGRFARGITAPQVVAISTQSSIATLPAMLAASDTLGIRPAVRDTVLPMAVSLFRITNPVANISIAIYVAWLYGVPLTTGTMITATALAAVVSLAAVGLPGQVSFFTTVGPVCLAVGAPVSVLPLLLAVEAIPDIFRTLGNVTADLAATRIVEVLTPGGEE